MNDDTRKQVGLLLDVLPEVAKEECFALHGGTAINLFLRNMPRVSVDIDLTYVEIAERNESLDRINAALVRIKERIETLRPTIRVQHKTKVCKLRLDECGVPVKIEMNMVGRGLLGEPCKMPLCEAAQVKFDAFCTMPLVPPAQTYGGKLCAALDRQHPRDLFDVKLLLENEGFTEEIKQGFIFGLISCNRPTHEMLNPHLLDQCAVLENQFEGMSDIEFSYDDFAATRLQLIELANVSLNRDDIEFLLSLNRLNPDWSIYDYRKFPAVKWKLLNLEKFKQGNPRAYELQLSKLEEVLGQ